MTKMLEILNSLCYNIFRKMHKNGKKDINMIKVLSLSNYIISLFEEQNCKITNLKLQKILYYIQGYFFKHFGEEAFADEIYSWQYGPVVPVVYYQYNHCGACPLKSEGTQNIQLEQKAEALIHKIVKKCMPIPSSTLVGKTHSELPWKSTEMGSVISKQDIRMFFKFNNPLEI